MIEPDDCQLEDMLSRQHIGAEIFLPFVITRLQGEAPNNEAVLTISLRDMPDVADADRSLKLRWDASSVSGQPLAVQEKVVTEWAACGVACAVISVYTGLQALTVADEGDRFDYWVGDADAQEYGLEVSGTLTEGRTEMETRHRAKVRQLLSNPYSVNGFVAVVGFAVREVILSFHRSAQEELQ